MRARPTGAAAPERLSGLRPPFFPGERSKVAQNRARNAPRERRSVVRCRSYFTLIHPRRHGRTCSGHPRLCSFTQNKTWMPGIKPGMTSRCAARQLRHERREALRGWPGVRGEPTCGCRKGAQRRRPVSRPVLYRELRNSNVYTGIALTNSQRPRRRLTLSRRPWRAAPRQRARARAM
jgi:hypothetical protein